MIFPTLAGKMFTPAPLPPAPNSVQYAMGVQAFQLQLVLGLGPWPWSRCRPRKWKHKVQDASSAARTARLNELQLVGSGLQDGSSRGDAAYLQLQSVTSAGQVGPWAKLVPAFGARINYSWSAGGAGLASWRELLIIRWWPWPGGSQGLQRPFA